MSQTPPVNNPRSVEGLQSDPRKEKYRRRRGLHSRSIPFLSLSDPVLDTIHQAGRLLRLNEKYGQERLEAACQRALDYGDPAYKTVKGILKNDLDRESQPILVQIPAAHTFTRQKDELMGTLTEATRWN